jgi:4-diphosphocytidyl-2-C-methyl-D-erythritol kinase
MDYAKLIAPAKVNLVLAVGNKREDGFHEVNTIIHALALHDSLDMRSLEPVVEGEGLNVVLKVTPEGMELPDIPLEENLIYKAITRLYEVCGFDHDEDIEVSLTKRIPVQAGLGGGSSDAAAALLGMCELWHFKKTDERVVQVAQELGSDVMFFLYGGCAYLTGKGEVFDHKIEPRKGFVVLLKPDFGILTGAAYAAFDEIGELADEDQLFNWSQVTHAADLTPFNNLAPASYSVNPELGEVYKWACARDEQRGAVLCGSGSAVCVFCDSYDDANAIAVDASLQGWWVRTTSWARIGASVIDSF